MINAAIMMIKPIMNTADTAITGRPSIFARDPSDEIVFCVISIVDGPAAS